MLIDSASTLRNALTGIAALCTRLRHTTEDTIRQRQIAPDHQPVAFQMTSKNETVARQRSCDDRKMQKGK